MKGDFTRFTFQPEKHYTGVYMQQGRLQLDSDWNEQVEIQKHLLRTYTRHLIDGSPHGGSGAPGQKDDKQNFAILHLAEAPDFTIAKGHIYVDGILCEAQKDFVYSKQTDHPDALKVDLGTEGLQKGKKYTAYLDVWEQNITALDDQAIAETALNGLDTTTRTKVVYQVKLIQADQWQNFLNRSRQRNARLTAIQSKQSVGNYLYRVEIHKVEKRQGDEKPQVSFKWSRDNGSSVLPVKEIKVSDHTIIVNGRDAGKIFTPGQWIEILDDRLEKNNLPGTFVQLIEVVSTDNKLIFDRHTADGDIFDVQDPPVEKRSLKVRGWNHDPNRADKAIYPALVNSKVTLEEGIEVEFDQDSDYQPGDFWLLPVRSNQQKAAWSGQRLQADGIHHHYLILSSSTYNPDNSNDTRKFFEEWTDQRLTFPTLIQCLNKQNLEAQFKPEKLAIGAPENLVPQRMASLQVWPTKVSLPENTAIFYDPNDQDDTIIAVVGFKPTEKLSVGDSLVVHGQERTIIDLTPQGSQSAFQVNAPLNLTSDAQHPEKAFQILRPIARFSPFESGQTATQVLISPQGRVGIGTDIPAATLTVQGKQDQTEIARFEDSAGTSQISITAQGGIVANSLELRGPTSTLKAGTFIGRRFELHNAADAIVAAIAIDHQQVQFKPAQPGASFAFAKFNDATPARLVVQGGVEADSLKLDQGITVTNFANSFDLAQGSDPKTVVPTISAVTAKLDTKADLHGSLNTWFNTQNLTVNGVLAFQQGGARVQHFSNHFTLLGGVDPQTSVPTVYAVQEYVGQRLANKPDREEVDRKLEAKANQAEVNARLAKKADLHGDPDQDFVVRDLKVHGAITLYDGVKVNEFSPQNLEISAAKPEDLVVPTAKAVKKYVDAQLVGKAAQLGDESLDFKARDLTVRHAIAQETLTLNGVAIGRIAAALEADSADDRALPTAKAVIDYAAPRGGSAKENYQAKNLTLAERLTVKGRSTTRTLVVGANPQNDVLQDGEASFAGNLYYKGKLLQESSRDLKRDITDLSSEEVSHLLRNLNPIKFSYTSDEAQQVHIGFLSEEVPEMLASVDQKAISISDIVGVLVQAVKEQRQATMALADVVDRQAAEMVQLKVQLKELEEKHRFRLG